jgi:transcriptional regulator with XRE-family HTH domain
MNETVMQQMATVIRGWRHHEELSIREAATMIGIDRNALTRIESGEGISGVTLTRLLTWLFG